jgi:hypothetical protein
MPMFVKVLEAFLETIIQCPSKCSRCFCSDFLNAQKLLSFQNTLFSQNLVKWGGDRSVEYGGCSKANKHIVLSEVLFDHQWQICRCAVRKKPACSYLCEIECFQLYSYFCWYLLNIRLVVSSQNIAPTLNVFITCQSWRSPAEYIIIDTHMAIKRTFMSRINLRLFVAGLPHASASIHNVFEGDLCSKTKF